MAPDGRSSDRWARFFELPTAVEPDDQAASAAEVADLEAAFNAHGMAYDPLDEDF